MRKIFKRVFIVVLMAGFGWVIHYAWVSFPIISGFGAKAVCTGVFVSHRNADIIIKEELGDMPLSLGSFEIDMKDSSVTGSVFGLAKRKAIYRSGIGATVINGLPEETIRKQVFNIPPAPQLNMDTIAWPMGDKVVDSIPAGIDKALLEIALNKAFEEPFADKQVRTRAVAIVYNGQLLAEKYADGINKNTQLYGWSMAKSVTSALIGTLVGQGKLDVNQPAPVPEWKADTDPRHAITLKNLLNQQSGLDFKEDYSGASDVTNMLYKEADMAAFTASHPLINAPGSTFSYTSGNSNIIARIIRQTVGEQAYAAYPFTALFYKAGMYHTLFEPDASGTYVGSSYIMATARDYARFGLLYMNDGLVNNERILPAGWVQQTVTAPATNSTKNYGYQFWLNGFSGNDATKRVYPAAPADMFYCDGYAGQFVYIIPSKKLVIVRLGLTLDGSFDENGFLQNILAAVK